MSSLVVVDDEDLARQVHAGEDPVEARDDRVTLVVDRDDDRDARPVGIGHTLHSALQQVPDVDDGHVGLELAVARRAACR